MADIRLKLTNCVLQYSNDDGMTWAAVEGWSPTDLATCIAENIVALVAPYTQEEVGSGQEPKCVATANTISFLQNLINQVINILGAGGNFTQLLGTIAGLILIVASGIGITVLSGGILLPFGAGLIGLTGYLISNGSSAIAAAFTSSFWEELRCLLYCQADEGGQWDASATSSIRNEISQKSGIAWQIIGYMIDILGAGGLTNTGRAGGVSSADCSGCDCPGECELFADTTLTIPPILNLDGTLTLISPSTPNTPEGEYFGQYRLPYANSCCRLEIVEITEFAYPTNAPFNYAGIRECGQVGNSFTNFTPPSSSPPILPDLDDECVNAFYIRSSVPYGIKVRLTDCEAPECQEFEVSSLSPSTNTLSVVSGVEYTVTATGVWSYSCGVSEFDANGDGAGAPGSNAILNSTDYGRLLWRIDNGGWNAGGTFFSFTAPTSGILQFTMNENTSGGVEHYSDNCGTLTIEICN